jgi:methyltransferase-like protein/protein-L-isoaspartate O-methyltransferase
MSARSNVYDSVPYPSFAFLQTHPDRLAVMGTLFGMNPPAVEHCRVLEIACGNGGNLIPMAFGLPSSEFVGVDLAARPVEMARDRITRLGLKNIRVEQADLMEIEPSFGEFDYIIAHGVFAWVPEPVQEKILAICKANLSTNGVAFVSYNTNPAGHVRQILREMIGFHKRRSAEATDKVNVERDFLGSILKVTDERSPWKALFREELKVNFDRDERVVFHDDLAECFAPVSFGDFAERAAHHGLQFLSEAHLSDALEPNLDPEALALLRQLAGDDLIAYQQYLDFAKYRRFRQTLLCHREIRLRRDEILQTLTKLFVASPMIVSAEQADGSVDFTNTQGPGTLQTNNPVIITVLRRLEQIWPHADRFEDLAGAVLRLAPQGQQKEIVEGLAQTLLKLGANQLASLRTYRLPLANTVSEKPTASLLARLMVQEGSKLTTLLHTNLNIEDEQGRRFLQLLDGTRDRQALTDALAANFAQDSSGDSHESLLKQVDENLVKFYRMGLLVA